MRIGIGIGVEFNLVGGINPSQLVNLFKQRVIADGGTFEADSCAVANVTELNDDGLFDPASLLVTPNGYEASKIFSMKPDDGAGDLTFSRASSAMRRNSSGLWESVTNNVPRLHYPVGGGCPSWLFEPQSTNILLRSDDLSNSLWTKVALTINSNIIDAPSVGAFADKIEETTATDFHQIYQDVITGATSYTFYAILKQGERDRCELTVDKGGSNPSAIFDLSNSVIISTANCTAKIESQGDGWYLCAITFTSVAATVYPVIRLVQSGTTTIYVGTTGYGLYVWTMQLEEGSYASSPITTSGAAVTRVADTIPSKVDSSLFGSGCVWFMHYKNNIAMGNDGTHLNAFYASQGAFPGNGIYIAPSNNTRLRLWTTAANVIFTTTADEVKLAIVFKPTTIDVYQNGVKVVSDYSYIVSPDRIGLLYPNVSQSVDGLYLFDSILSDAECEALTTI